MIRIFWPGLRRCVLIGKKVLCGLLLLLASGCAYSVHQVYVSDNIPFAALENGEVVKGQGEQFVIFSFTFDSDYVEKARQDLISNCPKGRLTSITTQHSTSLGFFSWTNKVLIQGLCVSNTKT